MRRAASPPPSANRKPSAPRHEAGGRTGTANQVSALQAVSPVPTDPYATHDRGHNEGHGRRLSSAFEALEAFPVLAESRNRVLRLFEAGEPPSADVVAAVE